VEVLSVLLILFPDTSVVFSKDLPVLAVLFFSSFWCRDNGKGKVVPVIFYLSSTPWWRIGGVEV